MAIYLKCVFDLNVSFVVFSCHDHHAVPRVVIEQADDGVGHFFRRGQGARESRIFALVRQVTIRTFLEEKLYTFLTFFFTVYMLDNLSRPSCSIAILGLEPLYIIKIMFRSDIENP